MIGRLVYLLEKDTVVLIHFNRLDLLSYVSRTLSTTRKVSIESMVQYQNPKYSLDVRKDKLFIWYGHHCARSQSLSDGSLLSIYDSFEIFRSGVFKYLEDEELERFIEGNWDAYAEFVRRDLCPIITSYLTN